MLRGFAVELFRLGVWLVLLAAIFVPLERLFPRQRSKVFRPGIVVDLCYYFLSGLIPAAVLSLPVAAVAWAAHRSVPDSVQIAIANWPFGLRAAAGLLVGEIGFYWGHRLTHAVPLLWRFHAIHHSAEHIDFLVNTRAHPVDLVFVRLFGLVPLYALGLASPAPSGSMVPVAIVLIGTTWGFFIHANVKWRLGKLEWLIATPGFHHWHHTKTVAKDHNYAAMLPWLDRIFGTHHLPSTWPDEYGIEGKMADTLAGQLLQPVLPGRRETVAAKFS